MAKPTASIEQLLADLHHPTDFLKRCDAARELGKVRDPRAVQALLGDLNDPDWRVRRNAAQALGASKAKEAVEPLIAALNDRTNTVRCRAAVGLGRIKDPRAIQPLVHTIETNTGAVFEAASKALTKFGKAAVPALLESMGKVKPPYRMELLRLLSEMPGGAKAAIYPLSEMLQDPDPAVRYQVALVLGKTGDKQVIDTLLRSLSDANLLVRSGAARALGNFNDPRIMPALIDQLDHPELLGPKRDLYQSITAALQQTSGMPKKFGVIYRNDPVWMAGMLGGSENPQVNDLIQRMTQMTEHFANLFSSGQNLSHPGMQFARDMIDKLTNSGNVARAEVEELIVLLSDPSPVMRAAATVSLPWYGNARALEPLRISRMDPDLDCRRAAAWAVEALELFLTYRQQM